MRKPATIVWFRQDLRLTDNPALLDAVERGGAVVPVFIYAPDEEGHAAPGGARRWWLHHSLKALASDLESLGSRLILREGPTRDALGDLVTKTKAGAVVWNRRYEPAVIERDKQIKQWLRHECDVEAVSHNSHLLFEPWQIKTGGGTPYQVFTPFWKNIKSLPEPSAARPAPDTLAAPPKWPTSTKLVTLGLEPTRDWKDGLAEVWTPGEAGAAARLDAFFDDAAKAYGDGRDRPAIEGTSRLSPHLHHGEIGPRQVWHAALKFMADKRRRLNGTEKDHVWTFLSEIGWREFAYHVLFHFPHTPEQPLKPKYAAFPWRDDADQLKRWQRGQTGYPIVDAGIRQLYATGWMHNRVRMIVGSLLVKHLLISWTEGAAWFEDTLVDADLASNTLGWQWIGGCGADASPYFRVFNPILQGEKFDADGGYVRRWVPELADLPDKLLHKPWEASDAVLTKAGVTLGETYPEPIIEHKKGRERALAALEAIK